MQRKLSGFPAERDRQLQIKNKREIKRKRVTKETIVSDIKTHTHSQQRVMLITPIFLLCHRGSDL